MNDDAAIKIKDCETIYLFVSLMIKESNSSSYYRVKHIVVTTLSQYCFSQSANFTKPFHRRDNLLAQTDWQIFYLFGNA